MIYFIRYFIYKIIMILILLVSSSVLFAENSSLTFLNRILSGTEHEYDKNINRLSQGKILLVDDPANYAIYEQLEKHIRAFGKDIENQSDMISYYKYQDAILGNIIEILQRIRELLLQKSNGILSDSDRELIDSEVAQQYDQIVFTLKESEFNTKKIFEGLFESGVIKKVFTGEDHFRLDNVDNLIDFFIKERTNTGAKMKGLEYLVSGESIAQENMEKMQSHGDTDVGIEMSALRLNHLKMLINILMLKQK